MTKRWPIDQTLLWDGTWRLCHGHIDGLPVFAFRTRPCAPPEGLATYRQLQALDKRPGGADPVALLRFRHRRPFRREELAPLWRIDLAVPKRQATPVQRAAIDKALMARRTCRTCPPGLGIKEYYIPTSLGQCWNCATDDLDPHIDETAFHTEPSVIVRESRAGAVEEEPCLP